MTAKKNEVYPLRMEGYGSSGEGVARLNGQAVFVKGALAGELCRVQLLKVGKSAAWGRVWMWWYAAAETVPLMKSSPGCFTAGWIFP